MSKESRIYETYLVEMAVISMRLIFERTASESGFQSRRLLLRMLCNTPAAGQDKNMYDYTEKASAGFLEDAGKKEGASGCGMDAPFQIQKTGRKGMQD